MTLNAHSSDRDIQNFIDNDIKKLNNQNSDITHLLTIIQSLCNLIPDTYKFYFACNKTVQNIEHEETIDALAKYLDKEKEKLSKNTEDRDSYYTIYHLISYYYWENKRISLLSNLIETYAGFFDEYALSYQIQGRLDRNHKRYKDALNKDRIALSILKKKNIINNAVRYTSAASIANALENGYYNVLTEDDIAEAMDAAEAAIKQNPTYHKWYYLKAKLIIYSIDYYYKTQKRSKYANYQFIIEEAIDNLNKAIDCLDSTARTYDSTKMKYDSYRLQADRIRSEIWLQEQLFEATETIRKMTEKQEKIETTLHDEQIKYLEILAVFVSVISIIVTIMGTTTNAYAMPDMLLIIVTMNVCVLAVYAGFLLLIKKKISIKCIIIELICVGIIVSIINPSFYKEAFSRIQHLYSIFFSSNKP